MNTIESKIKTMNREILALKTSHPLSSSMKTFWGEYTFELSQLAPDEYSHVYHTDYFEITYMDGNQPILSSVIANYNSDVYIGMFVLESPVNNKQVLAIWGTGHGVIVEAIISSSRQILGVKKINPPN